MSQRKSGYDRVEHDAYQTPEWVTEALIPHMPVIIGTVWEPACGEGKMARVLERHWPVVGTDIVRGENFLSATDTPRPEVVAIITNPPYKYAEQFIVHSLYFRNVPVSAFLLRADFDSAHSRRHLFANCERFAKKIVLTKRIKWFDDNRASPSFNHAWFVWGKGNAGKPTIAYGP